MNMQTATNPRTAGRTDINSYISSGDNLGSIDDCSYWHQSEQQANIMRTDQPIFYLLGEDEFTTNMPTGLNFQDIVISQSEEIQRVSARDNIGEENVASSVIESVTSNNAQAQRFQYLQQQEAMILVSPNKSLDAGNRSRHVESTGEINNRKELLMSSSSIDRIDLFDSAFAKRRTSSTNIDIDNIMKIMSNENDSKKNGKEMMVLSEKLIVPFVLSATPTKTAELKPDTKTSVENKNDKDTLSLHNILDEDESESDQIPHNISYIEDTKETGKQMTFNDVINELLAPSMTAEHEEVQGKPIPKRRTKSIPNRITFADDIEYREYSIVQYDHPSCKDGLALSLDWEHTEPYTLPFDIVCKERTFFYMQPSRLSYNERRQRLQEVAPLSYKVWRDEVLLGGTSSSTSSKNAASIRNSAKTQPDEYDSSSSVTTSSSITTNTDLSSIISRLQQSYTGNGLMSITNILIDDDDDDDDDNGYVSSSKFTSCKAD